MTDLQACPTLAALAARLGRIESILARLVGQRAMQEWDSSAELAAVHGDTDTPPTHNLLPCDLARVQQGVDCERVYPRRPARDLPSIQPDTKYLTAKQAALYLGLTYGTFRHKARNIRRTKHRRYTREALDQFAEKGIDAPKR